jgi:Na+-transporting NADH:ubiquinone oxidoreductase subunit F
MGVLTVISSRRPERVLREIEMRSHETVLRAMMRHQLFLPTACGGSGDCTGCAIEVLDGAGGLRPPQTKEKTMLQTLEVPDRQRLACCITPHQNLTVLYPYA